MWAKLSKKERETTRLRRRRQTSTLWTFDATRQLLCHKMSQQFALSLVTFTVFNYRMFLLRSKKLFLSCTCECVEDCERRKKRKYCTLNTLLLLLLPLLTHLVTLSLFLLLCFFMKIHTRLNDTARHSTRSVTCIILRVTAPWTSLRSSLFTTFHIFHLKLRTKIYFISPSKLHFFSSLSLSLFLRSLLQHTRPYPSVNSLASLFPLFSWPSSVAQCKARLTIRHQVVRESTQPGVFSIFAKVIKKCREKERPFSSLKPNRDMHVIAFAHFFPLPLSLSLPLDSEIPVTALPCSSRFF